MNALRNVLCDTGLILLLIAIACLGFLMEDRAKRPESAP